MFNKGIPFCFTKEEGGRSLMEQFSIGEKVQHKLTKDWFMVLRVEKDKYICRSKEYQEIALYNFEIEKLKEK